LRSGYNDRPDGFPWSLALIGMLVLPRQAHGPTEPKMLLKVMQTNVEWFNKQLGNGS
jgi:hypothetical protein